jgi:hypothetical protein
MRSSSGAAIPWSPRSAYIFRAPDSWLRQPNCQRWGAQNTGVGKVRSEATPAAQKAAVMRKVGPEFDVMDNEKGLDGSRPISEAIATRQGRDGAPEPGKRVPAPRPRDSGA